MEIASQETLLNEESNDAKAAVTVEEPGNGDGMMKEVGPEGEKPVKTP